MIIKVIVETAPTSFQIGHVIAGLRDFSVAMQEQERNDDLVRWTSDEMVDTEDKVMMDSENASVRIIQT